MTTGILRIKKFNPSKVYKVGVKTTRGIQWVSLGTTRLHEAHAICTEANIAKLQMAAQAEVLNADAISRLTTGRKFSCDDIRQAWIETISMHLAPATVDTYDITIKQLLRDNEAEKKTITRVGQKQLHAFVNQKGTNIGVRNQRLSACCSFYRYAQNAGYTMGNPAELVRINKWDMLFPELEKVPRVPITEEEYRRLMSSPACVGFNRYATALGWWLGLRIKDIACLEWASLKENSVVIWTKKSGTRVELPLGDPLIGGDELKTIIHDIHQQVDPDETYCFPHQQALATDVDKRSQICKTYGRVLARCKITGKSHHCLRHAAVSRWKAAGKGLEEIAGLVAHASVETTKGYDHSEE